MFEDPAGLNGRVLVYASDGSTVELTAEYEGWAWSGVATARRVHSSRCTGRGRRSSRPPTAECGASKPSLGIGSSIWMAAARRHDLARWARTHLEPSASATAAYGEAPTTAATFEGLQPTGRSGRGTGRPDHCGRPDV